MSALPFRIAAKIEIGDDCWLWTAAQNAGGYGIVGVATRRSGLAHRVVYEALVGPIPDGLTLDHVCRVRHCVNPRHLRPVTNYENVFAPGSQARAKLQSERTTCPRGHEYSHVRSCGRRACGECMRERMRRKRALRKAARVG